MIIGRKLLTDLPPGGKIQGFIGCIVLFLRQLLPKLVQFGCNRINSLYILIVAGSSRPSASQIICFANIQFILEARWLFIVFFWVLVFAEQSYLFSSLGQLIDYYS